MGDCDGRHRELSGEFITFTNSDEPVIWEPGGLRVGQALLPFPSQGERSVQFSPDGHLAALATGTELTLWDVKQQLCFQRISIDFKITGLSFSPLCHKLWVGGEVLQEEKNSGAHNRAFVFNLDYENPQNPNAPALQHFHEWKRGDHGRKFAESLF